MFHHGRAGVALPTRRVVGLVDGRIRRISWRSCRAISSRLESAAVKDRLNTARRDTDRQFAKEFDA